MHITVQSSVNQICFVLLVESSCFWTKQNEEQQIFAKLELLYESKISNHLRVSPCLGISFGKIIIERGRKINEKYIKKNQFSDSVVSVLDPFPSATVGKQNQSVEKKIDVFFSTFFLFRSADQVARKQFELSTCPFVHFFCCWLFAFLKSSV